MAYTAPASPFAAPPDTPWPLVDQWLRDAATTSAVPYPTAACFATVDSAGWPDARIVLAERSPPDAFLVLTDARSPKARHLEHSPRAALAFYWPPLERQLRLRCTATLADDSLAEALFEQRPRVSRGTAWASLQSQALDDPTALQQRLARVDESFNSVGAIPRPAHWRAFRLVPGTIELWQAAARRLHHRLLYTQTPEGRWHHQLLEP